jgi:hypothetical protein
MVHGMGNDLHQIPHYERCKFDLSRCEGSSNLYVGNYNRGRHIIEIERQVCFCCMV